MAKERKPEEMTEESNPLPQPIIGDPGGFTIDPPPTDDV